MFTGIRRFSILEPLGVSRTAVVYLLHCSVDDSEQSGDGPLPLTLENVERVLDEMRPYLMSDG